MAVFDNAAVLQPRVPELAAPGLALRDEGWSVMRLAPAPRGALVAAVDGLGRVLLLEGAHMALVRMWKVGGGGCG